MYTFSKRLKIVSISLFVLGVIGWGTSYVATHGLTLDDVKVLLAEENSHHGAAASHGEETHHDVQTDAEAHAAMIQSTHESESHDEETHGSEAHSGDAHAEHVLHLLQNKPWSALYVALFFFFMISLGTLAFYAIQHASQAGWSVVLFRVMEGITAYLPVGGILLFVFFVLSSLHMNHLFVWMDPEVVAHDELIQNKTGYLNVPFFLARAAIYIGGWILYRQHARKLTLAQDNATPGDISNFTKLFK